MWYVEHQESNNHQSERGISMISVAICLPFMMLLLLAVMNFAQWFNQAMWVEQTAYNAALMSSELDSSMSNAEKVSAVKEFAQKLYSVHINKDRNDRFLTLDTDPVEVFPFDPSNPGDRLTSVAISGTMAKVMNHGNSISDIFRSPLSLKRRVDAPSLVNGNPTVADSNFRGSGGGGSYGSPDCCGQYSGSSPSSCVSGGSYEFPSGCNAQTDGFFHPN